jgi:hypothetical protein
MEKFSDIEKHKTILVTGMTGTGKSYMLDAYLAYMGEKYESWKIRAYNVVLHDYHKNQPFWSYVEKVRIDNYCDALDEDIEYVKSNPEKKTTIHITECDPMHFCPEKVIELFRVVSESDNVQVIYETSRPGKVEVPDELLELVDYRLETRIEDNEYVVREL